MLANIFFDYKVLNNQRGAYWEFHFKISSRDFGDFERLLKWKNNHVMAKNIAISMSDTGATKYPIVTIRLHEGSRRDAIKVKDTVINEIKSMGLHIHDKLQAECSIYDTYPEEDDGWFKN